MNTQDTLLYLEEWKQTLKMISDDDFMRNYLFLQGHMMNLSVMNALLTAKQTSGITELHTPWEWAQRGNPVKEWLVTENPETTVSGRIVLLMPIERTSNDHMLDQSYEPILVYGNKSCIDPEPVVPSYNMQVLMGALIDTISGNSGLIDHDHELESYEREGGRPLFAKLQTDGEYEGTIQYHPVDQSKSERFCECMIHEYFLYLFWSGCVSEHLPFVRKDYTYTANLITRLVCHALNIWIDPQAIVNATQNMPDDEKGRFQYLIDCKNAAENLIQRTLWCYYRRMNQGIPELDFTLREEVPRA